MALMNVSASIRASATREAERSVGHDAEASSSSASTAGACLSCPSATTASICSVGSTPRAVATFSSVSPAAGWPINPSDRTACTRTASGCAASAATACSAGTAGSCFSVPRPFAANARVTCPSPVRSAVSGPAARGFPTRWNANATGHQRLRG